jgi:putative tricarboxylic transport membrane protein
MEHLWLGLFALFTPQTLLYLLIGCAVFMVVGLLPGLTGPVGMALLVPISYGLPTNAAFAMLVGGHAAMCFAGSITAIVMGVPGTGMNVATVFDGYQMTKKGRAGEAVGAAAMSSTLGSVFGAIVLAATVPVLRPLVLLFGPPEIFAVCMLGIACVALVAEKNVWRGVMMGLVGIWLSTIGYNPITGSLRFTFNLPELWDGVELIAVIVGLFAFAEMIDLYVQGHSISERKAPVMHGIFSGIMSALKHWWLIIRGSIIGTIVGIIPGVGGPTAVFAAYAHARQTSRDPESFGKGNIEGVIAPESSNNAKDGGALIPTIAFGIPGSTVMAILLAALYMHGLQPGRDLLTNQQTFLFSLVWLLVLGGILGSVIGLAGTNFLAKITNVSYKIVVPAIIVVSALGTIVYRNLFADLIIAGVFGIVGYIMKKLEFPNSTLIIGLVLGNKIETSLFTSTQLYGAEFLLRPLVVIMLALLIVVMAWPSVGKALKRRKAAVAAGR